MSIAERAVEPEVAEAWIRDALRIDPQGVCLTVSGTCMEPSLPERSKVTLLPPPAAVRVGDVVLLRTVASLRLHRVLVSGRTGIRTKGDRGMYLDPGAPPSAVIGVCETNESRLALRVRAVLSLARLLARPMAAPFTAGRGGDTPHARLLA